MGSILSGEGSDGIRHFLVTATDYVFDAAPLCEGLARFKGIYADYLCSCQLEELGTEVSNAAESEHDDPVIQLHVGHLKTYAVGDAIAHFHRRNGFQVMHPMGYDSFGLPAENHATAGTKSSLTSATTCGRTSRS